MNEVEKKKFQEFWGKFHFGVKESLPMIDRRKLSKKDLFEMIGLLSLEVADLRKIIFFIIVALAGEGYCTGELREAMRRTGLLSLYQEFLGRR